MTGREKIEAALSLEGTPAFAAVTCYQSLFLRDHWEQATDAPWWAQSDPDPERAARPWLEMIARTGEDWLRVGHGHNRQARTDLAIEVDGDEVWQVNHATGERTSLRRPPIGGFQPAPQAGRQMPASAVQTPEELEAVIDSVFGARDTGPVVTDDGSLDLPHLVVDQVGDAIMPMSHVGAPWWHCHSLWGFADLMMRMVEAPELVHQACRRLLESNIRGVQRAAAAGAGLMWIEDCMSDMISPAQCREFSLAYVRPLVEAIQEAGMLAVHYYCGRADDRWEYLLDTGADALSLEEGKKGFEIDILQVAEMVDGRMALLGNIDAIAVMEHGSDAALRAEVARQCDAGRRNRGRFVASIGSPVTPGTPIERVRRYCELVHELG